MSDTLVTPPASQDTSASEGINIEKKDEAKPGTPVTENGAGTEERLFTQAEVNAALAREKRIQKETFDRQQAEAKKAEEKRQQEEQGQFQTLWQEQVTENASLNERLAAAESTARMLSERFNKQVDDEVKEWNPKVKQLDPGPDNPIARMEWLPLGRDIQTAFKLASQGGPDDLGKRSQQGDRYAITQEDTERGMHQMARQF